MIGTDTQKIFFCFLATFTEHSKPRNGKRRHKIQKSVWQKAYLGRPMLIFAAARFTTSGSTAPICARSA